MEELRQVALEALEAWPARYAHRLGRHQVGAIKGDHVQLPL